jgi:DNA adenine methylase
MRGPLNYVGGKNRLAKVIIERIPEHLTYVEPFSGGAQVFFRKPRSTIEVLNDLDSQLINFYRVCQHHSEELIRSVCSMPVSRELFDSLKKGYPEGLTDIQRASRFLYLQKLAYGGRVTRKAFGIHIEEKPNLRAVSIMKSLAEVHDRLQGVQIEHLPYDEVIRRYDRPGTFHYIDPPYYDIRLYNFNFEHDDFVRMAKLLGNIQGKFLMSLNDHPKVREIFSDFYIEEVQIAYSLHSTVGKRHKELLISNYRQPVVAAENDEHEEAT